MVSITNTVREDQTNIKKITLVELPYQNLLQIKPLSSCSLIYCSKEAPNSENCQALRELETENDEVAFVHCADIERAHKMIKAAVHAVLVVSGELGLSLLPQLCGGLDKVANVTSCIVYSQSSTHQTMQKDFEIVKHFTSDIGEAAKIAKELIGDTLALRTYN